MGTLQEQLYRLCEEHITKQEAAFKKAIDELQDAANNETKSSAGDKYETGREMMQQEIDLNQLRLSEQQKLRAALEYITPAKKSAVIQPGSVVYTNNGNFYLAVSAGKLVVGGVTFYAISITSPMGVKLAGQQVGHSFELNGKAYQVLEVC